MSDPTTPRPVIRLVTAPGPSADEPTAAPDDGAVLRLAIWLADVAAEAGAPASAASAEPSRIEERAVEPSGGRRTS